MSIFVSCHHLNWFGLFWSQVAKDVPCECRRFSSKAGFAAIHCPICRLCFSATCVVEGALGGGASGKTMCVNRRALLPGVFVRYSCWSTSLLAVL